MIKDWYSAPWDLITVNLRYGLYSEKKKNDDQDRFLPLMQESLSTAATTRKTAFAR